MLLNRGFTKTTETNVSSTCGYCCSNNLITGTVIAISPSEEKRKTNMCFCALNQQGFFVYIKPGLVKHRCTFTYSSKSQSSICSTRLVRSWLDVSIRRLMCKAVTGSIPGSRTISSRCHCTVSTQFLAYSKCSIEPVVCGLLMGVFTLSCT